MAEKTEVGKGTCATRSARARAHGWEWLGRGGAWYLRRGGGFPTAGLRTALRILAIEPSCPWPPDHGGRQRAFHLLRSLVATHELTVLAGVASDEEAGFAAGLAKEGIATKTARLQPRFGRLPWSTRLAKVPLLLTGASTLIPRFRSAEMLELLRTHLTSQVDLVLVSHLWMTAYLPELNGRPFVLSTHNVESQVQLRKAELIEKGVLAEQTRREGRALARAEAQAVARAKLTIAVSLLDAEHLRALAPGSPISVIPNGVDLARNRFEPHSRTGPLRLYYLGGYDYEPNRQAAIRLATAILPLVRSTYPDAEAWIGGKDPEGVLAKLDGLPGVRRLGHVPDLDEFYRQVDMLVAPLNYGGGSRIKILEAWARGRPVVTSKAGAEGLDLHAGPSWSLAYTDQEFAREIINVASSSDIFSRAEIARRFVETEHDWDRLGQRFAHQIASLVP